MRRSPLCFVDGEIRESGRDFLMAIYMGFPSMTVGGKVTSADTAVHSFGSLVGVGIGDEELVAPLRLQVSSGATGTLTVLRQKDNGDPPLITDVDHFLAVLGASGFMIADEVNKLDKIYYCFSINAGTEIFYWSAGYGEE